eukprot:1392173-Alexandrium_andersonii.AAC.1
MHSHGPWRPVWHFSQKAAGARAHAQRGQPDVSVGAHAHGPGLQGVSKWSTCDAQSVQMLHPQVLNTHFLQTQNMQFDIVCVPK